MKYSVSVNGKILEVEVIHRKSNSITFKAKEKIYEVSLSSSPIGQTGKSVQSINEVTNDIIAPIPGVVSDIKVKEGDSVKAGDVVLVLEAMKMENNIVAPREGTIGKIFIQKGQEVGLGVKLVEFS